MKEGDLIKDDDGSVYEIGVRVGKHLSAMSNDELLETFRRWALYASDHGWSHAFGLIVRAYSAGLNRAADRAEGQRPCCDGKPHSEYDFPHFADDLRSYVYRFKEAAENVTPPEQAENDPQKR